MRCKSHLLITNLDDVFFSTDNDFFIQRIQISWGQIHHYYPIISETVVADSKPQRWFEESYRVIHNVETYSGQGNIILQTTFSNTFFEWRLLNFKWNSIEIRYLWFWWQYVNIGSDNGLAPNRRQAISWTNEGMFYWRTYTLFFWCRHIRSDIVSNFEKKDWSKMTCLTSLIIISN